VIHKWRWRTAPREWKTSRRWGILRRSSSRGDRWGAAAVRASLRRLSSGRTLARTQQSRAARRYTGMQLRRALVAGALVTAFLLPATAGFAQESPSTTTSTTTTSTTTTTPTTTAPPTSAPGPITPTPDPDAFAALANQISQNQAMLTQLSAQVAEATQKLAAL